jgi:hypothetical protein
MAAENFGEWLILAYHIEICGAKPEFPLEATTNGSKLPIGKTLNPRAERSLNKLRSIKPKN